MQAQKSYDLAGRKIFFGLPAYDFKIAVKTATSLLRFAMAAQAHGVQIQIGSICGCSVVSKARNAIVADFLESDCTDLMFIDSDITFEPEAVFRLMAWASDPKKGIVAAIPVSRKPGKNFISTLDSDEDNNIVMNGMGLVRAKRVATAFMLIQRKVLTDLDEAHPEWKYWDENSQKIQKSFFDFKSTPQGYIGEDYLFCDRARALNHEVWVDPTIRLGHLGLMEFDGCLGEDYLYPRLAPVDASKEAA
jgi:hypothetical protein